MYETLGKALVVSILMFFGLVAIILVSSGVAALKDILYNKIPDWIAMIFAALVVFMVIGIFATQIWWFLP